MSEEDIERRESLALQELHSLWELYSCTFVYQEKKRHLYDFLKRFVEFFDGHDPLLIKLRFHLIDDVARTLSLYLSEELASILKYGPVPPTVAVYEYFAGMTGLGEGLYLLRSVEIITRLKMNAVPASLGRALVTILVKIISLPPSSLSSHSSHSSLSLSHSSLSSSSSVASSPSPFSSFSSLSSSSASLSSSSSLPAHRTPIGYHHHHYRSFPSVPIPSYNFSPICTYFGVTPIHPEFSSLFGDAILRSSPVTPVPLSGSRIIRGRSGSRGRISFENSSNSTCGIVCYHILSILGNMFSDKLNLLELLVKHDTTTPLLLGVLSTATSAYATHATPSPTQSPSQVHLHPHAQTHASQAHPAHSPSPVQSQHSLLAIAQAHAQAQAQQNNNAQGNANTSAHAFLQSQAQTQTQSAGDAGQIHVFRQLVRTLSKLLDTACDSLAFIEMLVARQVFMYIINILKQGPSHSLPTVLSLELSQLLVFSLKKSTRVNQCLMDEFNSHSGYAVLAENLIYVSKVGTAEQKLEFISTVCHLLFIGADYSHRYSNYFEEDNKVSTGALNVEVFQKIFLRVFAAGTSDDMKTELLKTMRAIFSLGSSGYSELGYGRTIDGFQLLSHLSPFKTLFSYFDNLNISNRRMVLSMMDEVLLSHDTLRNEELQVYCYLLQGKRPSTLLLITQHMTALLAEGRISRDKMKEVGLVPVLVEYLIHPLELLCRSMLVDPAELSLSVSLLPHTYFTQEAYEAEQERHNISIDINTLNVLYGITVSMLNLMLIFLADNAHNQAHFNDLNGLKKLYHLLTDNVLIQPTLRVLAIMAIGNLKLETKIVPSLILALQASGGATTLESGVLVMRKYILSTLCYIFHHNPTAKNAFRVGGGFAWAVTILDGIGRCVERIKQHKRGLWKHKLAPLEVDVYESTPETTPTSTPNKLDLSGGPNFESPISETAFPNSEISTPNSEKQRSPVSEARRSSVRFDLPPEQDLLQRRRSRGNSISPENTGVPVPAIVVKSPNLTTTTTTIVPDPTGPTSSPTTNPPNYPTTKEIFYFLKALLDTLAAVLNNHHKNQVYFREDICFSTLTETLKACHFIEGVHAIELCDSLLNMAVIGSWPPSCPQHRMMSPSLLCNFQPYLYHPTIPETNQLVMNDEVGEEGSFMESISPQLTFGPNPSINELSMSSDTIMDSPISPEDFNSKAAEPAYIKATQQTSHCAACRESLQIENPEIFKIIFQLMGGTDSDTRKNISKLDYHSTTQILKALLYLTCLSSVNMQRLSNSGLLVDILGYFKPMFTDIKPIRLKRQKKGSRKKIRSLLLTIVQALGSHNITVMELRKYFEFLRNPDAPIELVDTLIGMARRDHTPCYNIDFSKNGLESVDIPMHERQWPPGKGYFVSFWFRVSSYGVDQNSGNSLPICLFSMEGYKGTRLEATILKNVISFTAQQHNGHPETYAFREVQFDDGIWYHTAITHSVGGSLSGKKSILKLYVNGSYRTQGVLQFPKTSSCRVNVKFGASIGSSAPNSTNNSSHNSTEISSSQLPIPMFLPSLSPIPSWQLGTVYFFEEVPADTEVFMLYSLGPNYAAGLKSDMGLAEVFEAFSEKTARLHSYQIEYMLHPNTSSLSNLHEKIVFILCTRNLVVSQAFKLPTFPAAGTGAPAVTRMLAPSYAITHHRTTFATNHSFSLPSPLPLSSSSPSLYMSSGSNSPYLSPSPILLERSNSMANLFQIPSAPGTPTVSRPTTPSLLLNSIPPLLSLSAAIERSPSRDSRDSSPPSGNISALFGSPASPAPISSLNSSLALSPTPAPPPNIGPSPALPMPNMINFAATHGSQQTVIPSVSDLGPPTGVRVRNGVKDIMYNIGGVSTIIYLIATAQTAEYQRSSMRLLYTVLQNNARNLREMKEIGGYQIVARLMRKKRWEVDETMLSIVFGFAGLHKNIKSPMYYSSGVISDLMAFKCFLLEWKIWKRASLAIQKTLFESLAKLISVHDYSAFNIARFRQINATQTLINMFQEPDLPSAVMPALLTILKNLLRESNRFGEDLLPLFQYIIATHPTPHITSHQVSFTDKGLPSPVPAFRRRKAVSDDRLVGSEGISVRVMVLALLLDILSTFEANAVEEFTQMCNMDILYGLLNHESLRTRIIILKLLDLCVKTPSMSGQFKVNGFAILGSLLQNFEVSEELFGVLICMMLGKPAYRFQTADSTPTISNSSSSNNLSGLNGSTTNLNNNNNNSSSNINNSSNYSYILSFFLGQLSTDLSLQHPQAVTTILTLLGSSRDLAPSLQHSIIKIIHDIFLQNDLVKAQMLENGLVDGLVELLVSNFQIRYARFAENEPPLGWETEEDILCFFKEIALFGCKNASNVALLKEILMTINLYSTLPYTYVCCLQRRVIHDVFLFFHDNDFSAHEFLSASFDKLCALTVSILCHQTPSNFNNKAKLMRQSSQAVFSESRISSRSDISISSDDTGTPRASDDEQSSTGVTPRKNNATENSAGETETSENSSTATHTTPSKSVSSISLSKASVSVTDEGADAGTHAHASSAQTQQTHAHAQGVGNSPVPALNLSNTSSVLPTTPNLEGRGRRTSSPRFTGNDSPRSPVVPPTPTLMRANSDYYVVDDQVRSLSASAELYARQQEWVDQGHLYNEKEFIDLLFVIFTARRRNTLAPSSHMEYFSVVSGVLLQRNYLSKLIIHFLQNPQYEKYFSHIVSLLLSQGPDDLPIVVDFITDEESILRILFALRPMLHFAEENILLKVRKIYQLVFQAASVKPVPAYKKMQLLKEDDKTEFDHVLETMLQPDVPPELVTDFKKWHDKEETQKKEFQIVFRETFKTKQETFSKTQAAIRFNKHLVNTTMASMHQQQFKPMHERMQLEMEEEREQQQQWRRLVKHIAHERGIWPANDQQAVIKWELDPTEGPARMRIRLKSVDQHPSTPFVTASLSSLSSSSIPDTPDSSTPDFISPEGLKAHYLHMQAEHTSVGDMKTIASLNIVTPRERITFSLRTSRITPFSQQIGELLIGENNLYFIDERRMQGAGSALGKSRSGRQRQTLMGNKPKQVMFPYEEIREIHKRRHLLKNNALEIFLLSGKTYLLAFEKMADRDSVYDKINSMDLPELINYQTEMQGTILKMSITKKWQKGFISNFEYLIHLNTLAGRSFNDLTQYPVFPFIMRDSIEYDVENTDNMRDLTKPMGAQDPVRLSKFIKKYNDLMDMPEEEGPYHYGSHYSNSGSVLHFLLRIEPFSGGFLDFQGGKFDVPDRSFHDIEQTWRLSSCQSSSDVKELIPEFFVLPEFLVNKNRFDFGKKQNGQRVDDVILPPWAKQNPRYYIYKHRQALESKYVSLNLHHWIDLIFGCKQQGDLAVKAFNVFHPCTYEGAVDVDKIDDPLQRDAKISQISNFGQIPKQLFQNKHPAKNLQKLNQAISDCVYSHPCHLTPFQIGIGGAVGSIVFINEAAVALAPRKVLLYPDTSKYISWGHWDQTLRICSMDTGKVITTIDIMHDDDILCGDMTKNGRLLVTGGTSCVAKVWRRPNKNNKEKADTLVLATTLCGHSDPILSLVVSQEWSIIVTGSADKTCIIWDLNRFAYVRSLVKHEGPVTVVAVSPTLGYIATACVVPKGNNSGYLYSSNNSITNNNNNNNTNNNNNINNSSYNNCASVLRLWSINGDELASITSMEKITSAIFTGGMEGVVQNLLITGHENGMIKIYNAWDLSFVFSYNDSHRAPISALALSKDATQLFSGDTGGLTVCWSWKKPRDNYTLGIRI